MKPHRAQVRTRLAFMHAGVFLAVSALYMAINFGIIERYREHDDSGLFDAISGALIATSVAAGAGWWIAGRTLQPLRTVTETARQVSATTLDERIDLDGPDDELKELADTIDALLDRLEASFERERRFVANASHELRTPLAVTRTALELGLQHGEPTTKVLEQALRSTARSEALVKELLLLARSERLDPRQWETFDLSELAGEVASELAGRAKEADVRLQTELHRAPMIGAADLVDRLMVNLVDNAIVHNMEGGQIDITTGSSMAATTLRISNTCRRNSPGPADQLLEPFRRSTPMEERRSAGHGLGLSIVKAIAESHHGDVHCAFLGDGSRFEVQVAFRLGQS